METISQTILEKYQVRKTKAQKLAFIELLKTHFPDLTVEEGGFLRCRNIVLGDVETAKVVFGAHYDTCAVLPVPNMLFPKNILFSLLYGFLIAVPVLVLGALLGYGLNLIFDNFWVGYWGTLIGFFVVFVGIFILGVPNRHTANDNTSGVVTLCELYAALDEQTRQQVAFVFFDHEESGLFGSGFFAKKHKQKMKDTLLINFDCVGDGKHMFLIANRKAKKDHGPQLRDAFAESSLPIHHESADWVFYPSDQTHFKKNIGVAAFHKTPLLGYRIGRIHTPRDTVLQEENIACLVQGMKNFVQTI